MAMLLTALSGACTHDDNDNDGLNWIVWCTEDVPSLLLTLSSLLLTNCVLANCVQAGSTFIRTYHYGNVVKEWQVSREDAASILSHLAASR
eukprot:1146804-Pelagomonas_calceolata.AAC.2